MGYRLSYHYICWQEDPYVSQKLYTGTSAHTTRFYRGIVKNDEPKSKVVFFIDYGETLNVLDEQVHPCPVSIGERLKAQAIPCFLAHVSIPTVYLERALNAMKNLADDAHTWILKVRTYN
ncbi:hypothetical protein SK128_022196 [Halocaridina rubra]|uniref:Tudor domain-containing protein n=1 Tax=Halocaridina rubra TaxID=373956 RepID=A0AAN9AAR2_HALRR